MINKLRISMLTNASNCQRMAIANGYTSQLIDLGYNIKTKERVGAYAPVGTGTHAAGRYILTQKILGKKCKVKDAIDVGISEFEKETENVEIEYDKTITNEESAKAHTKRFAEIYYRDVAPHITFPEGAKPEDHLELYIKKTFMDFGITGHIDIYTGAIIDDTKTGAKEKSYHHQIGGYGLLIGQDNFEKLIMTYIPRVSLKKEYPGTKRIEYNKKFCLTEAYTTLVRTINAIKDFNKNNKPSCFAANPHSFLCSAKYCKAYDTDFCGYKKG